MLQDLVFIPVGMGLSDHLHGAFEQGYAIYPGWHADWLQLLVAECWKLLSFRLLIS